ncbi:hypothetical protein PAXRUDRAFT_827916 [Paxillus rubicundulus Ve08.2h10]|uniref:Uncharacterized protein n=1 Tax=Paxillus rubicundulus Ve08.2h10 TaxID=930991 RepID=A0A0D0DQC0_9AGAM|nr:hypothetical protein PAXRUDRAFT_827916 [Paxillus rubicundulus Ve08.2h10]
MQAQGESPRFDLPSFRLERPSPDTGSRVPSSPISPLLFSGTHCGYDFDGDDFPDTESPLAGR